MATLLIRNVPEDIVSRLKDRAKKRNRSLQQELQSILVATATQSSEDLLKKSSMIRAKLRKKGITFSDSAELLREDRSR
jgi:antitoxin FitA